MFSSKRGRADKYELVCLCMFLGLLIATSASTGCRGKQPISDASDESANGAPVFQWDTERPVPRWRENSPIQWYGTFQQEEVVQESLSSGKPILFYVSRDEWGYNRRAIEIQLLSADGWDELIAENFVAWNIDFWEDPTIALQIMIGGANALESAPLDPPCLLILKPSEIATEPLNVVNLW